MKLILGKNSTSNLINIFIQDSSASTKTGLTGIDYTKVKSYYYKTGEYHSHQITLTNSNVGIWRSGGFVEVDAVGMPGLYQLQLPDIVTTDDSMSVLDNSVTLFVKDNGSNNVTLVTLEIQLTENSLDDFATVYDTLDANIVSVLGIATDGTFNANITEVNGSSVAVSTSVDANVVAVNGTEVSDVITAGETVPSDLVAINGHSTIDVGQSAELTPYEWYQQVYIELENTREDVLNISFTDPVTIAAGGITATSFAAGSIDANTFAAGAITAATIADNSIDLATFAADVKTGAALKANVESMSANTITDSAIADSAEINANVMHWAGFDAQATSSGLPDVNTVNVEEIVETLLKYDFSSISGEASRSVLNSLRKLMNKISLSAVALTVYKEDDVTVAYTQTATTDPLGIDPVIGLDTV